MRKEEEEEMGGVVVKKKKKKREEWRARFLSSGRSRWKGLLYI